MSEPALQFTERCLRLTWVDGHESVFHAVWLRDNCPEDRDQRTGQRLVDIADLPPDPRIAAIERAPDSISVRWAGEERECGFANSWLRANCTCVEHIRQALGKVTHWPPAQAPDFCWSEYADVRDSVPARIGWLRAIASHGLAFLRGVPVTDGQVLEAASFLGYVTETNYGRVFNVQAVKDPNNLAYTAARLGVHTDNPYRDPVPGYQILHCMQASPEGGASIFVDGFAVAERLREQDAEAFEILSETPFAFAFRDGDAELRAERPLIQTGARGEVTAVHYNNRSIAPLRIGEEEVPAVYRAYRRFAAMLRDPSFEFRINLAEGELVVFDNHRVLHGRTAFTGPRHLQGCYVNRDGLLSNLAVLSREEGI